jgi:hypothetical protein
VGFSGFRLSFAPLPRWALTRMLQPRTCRATAPKRTASASPRSAARSQPIYETCLNTERDAALALRARWRSIPASVRKHCNRFATYGGEGSWPDQHRLARRRPMVPTTSIRTHRARVARREEGQAKASSEGPTATNTNRFSSAYAADRDCRCGDSRLPRIGSTRSRMMSSPSVRLAASSGYISPKPDRDLIRP